MELELRPEGGVARALAFLGSDSGDVSKCR